MSYLVSKSEYERRFSDRLLAPPNPKPAPSKFAPDGSIEPFYGLTCIAWINQESELFRKLCDLQLAFIKELEEAGLRDFFAFLRPESFHMTICDINASQDSRRCFKKEIIETVQHAFDCIGTSEEVVARVRGIGLKTTITALVKFDDERELHKVLGIEHKIKEPVLEMPFNVRQSNCVRTRGFSGHISLAYCVRAPAEEDAESIRAVLRPYEDRDLGKFAFSQFDLTYFTDMNKYIPILTLNLNDGTVLSHTSNIEMLENITALFKAVRSLLETWAHTNS